MISFGADFLGTWNSPVAQNIAYGEMRQGRPGIRGKFVQVEYRMSPTGANADEWVAVKPGTEGVSRWDCQCHHEVGRAEGSRCGARRGSHRRLGMGACRLHATGSGKKDRRSSRPYRTNRERICGQKPALAIIAGPAVAQTNGLFNALAVNALNALVGSVETAGGILFTPTANSGTDTRFRGRPNWRQSPDSFPRRR